MESVSDDPDYTKQGEDFLPLEDSHEDDINLSDWVCFQSERGFGYYKLHDLVTWRPQKIDLAESAADATHMDDKWKNIKSTRGGSNFDIDVPELE